MSELVTVVVLVKHSHVKKKDQKVMFYIQMEALFLLVLFHSQFLRLHILLYKYYC